MRQVDFRKKLAASRNLHPHEPKKLLCCAKVLRRGNDCTATREKPAQIAGQRSRFGL
uniref:Uncharacterized protein n=1 Tax=uncultured bacterium A1Q1_fos_504 TaxID=1256580 RepID=L7VRV2_9BACT|nr:hypothetical protein [uncultured bacterium A1Q1_fos_504]